VYINIYRQRVVINNSRASGIKDQTAFDIQRSYELDIAGVTYTRRLVQDRIYWKAWIVQRVVVLLWGALIRSRPYDTVPAVTFRAETPND